MLYTITKSTGKRVQLQSKNGERACTNEANFPAPSVNSMPKYVHTY